MKKKILSVLIIGIVSFGLISCGEKPTDVINKNTTSTSDNRFIDTGDIYMIDDWGYKIFYDSTNNIVYMSHNRNSGYGSTASLTPLIGKDKLPMTLEEYNQTK